MERERPKKARSERRRASREKSETELVKTPKIGRTRPRKKKRASRVRERRGVMLSLIWLSSYAKAQKNSKPFFIDRPFQLLSVYNSLLF